MERKIYSIRLTSDSGEERDDFLNDAGEATLTLPEAKNWMERNTVSGQLTGYDNDQWTAKIVEWA